MSRLRGPDATATAVGGSVPATPPAVRVRLPESARAAWLWLGVAGLGAAALYAPLFPGLMREWAEFPSLSHGFAIPFIAAYLIWARRERFATAIPTPTLAGLPLLLLGLGTLALGAAADEPFIARTSLPVTLLGLAVFLGGPRLTRDLWAGIAYLAFMIPLPWATLKMIMYRSRLLDAEVSANALQHLGVPVNRDGVLLHLPNITLEVADDCSSIPAIAALLALGMAYAAMSARPLWTRVALIAATLPLAILANIIRITSVAWAAYQIGPWTLHTTYHMFNGTVNFLFTFLLLLGLDSALGRFARRAPR
jgi:exosortase